MSQFLLVSFNGLAWAMAVFLVASGLTLVFGILHILNFSHGGIFMICAYVALTLQPLWGVPESVMSFVAAILGAVVVGAVIGLLVDRAVFTRLQGVPEAYSLIATYALLLICQGIVKLIWGIDFRSAPPPEALGGALEIGDVYLPTYSVLIIVAGLLTFLLLEIAIYRTSIGKLLRAVAIDPWMAGIAGLNVQVVFTLTVVSGFALAGLAGGILLANQSLSPELGSTFIIQAFGAIIVGGMGNIRGAFLACILLGLFNAFGIALYPEIPGAYFYLALVLMILVRPQGLLGSVRT